MKPVKQNLEIWQGKTYEEPFTFGRAVKDDAGELVDIIATNLSGYTGRMQLRTSIDSEDVVIELTTENDRIIIDEEHGIVTLYISDEDTALLPVGSYKYDLELITASGRVYGPLYGTVKVKAEVTRDA
jgi:hypothetical protein